MKTKPILTALAVTFAALAQPALAGFTQNEKGEVTHYNGIPLPPIQTVEEAKAQAQKEIAAAKKAQEAEQAAAASASNLQSEIGNQQLFFTGKPYLEETGQYLFIFRHYDPKLARWTTADQSGFPDGANNVDNMPVPTFAIDWQGLEVKLVFTANSGTLTEEDLQTGQKLSISGVLSGNGVSTNKAQDDWKVNEGPIPRGSWLVGQQQANGWYRLYGPNGQGGYSYSHVEVTDPDGNTVVRSDFNLHEGTLSLGCVTVNASDWAALETMLNNTQTFTYNNSSFTGRLEVKE